MKDKYSAIWVSHSSMSDYLQCPRAYYLRNMYRDPKTNHKVALVSPSLALGQVVHDVIESVAKLPAAERFIEPLTLRFESAWKTVEGKKGGFFDTEKEKIAKNRGLLMMQRLIKHPGPLVRKAIKIRQDLPYYWISEEENIILCGKIDWLEYQEESDSVKIIDFKTGKFDEDSNSLQLPIYYLLAKHTQMRKVTGAMYWYLDRDDEPVDMPLPDEEDATKRVLELAKKVVLARKLERFVCKSKDGCRNCRPYELIIAGKAEFVGRNTFGQDQYVLPSQSDTVSRQIETESDDSEMPF